VNKNSEDPKLSFAVSKIVYNACPHCGQDLSPWQRVLLTVDRALVCRKCWFRIILRVTKEPNKKADS
jgi:hypothetical protein